MSQLTSQKNGIKLVSQLNIPFWWGGTREWITRPESKPPISPFEKGDLKNLIKEIGYYMVQ